MAMLSSEPPAVSEVRKAILGGAPEDLAALLSPSVADATPTRQLVQYAVLAIMATEGDDPVRLSIVLKVAGARASEVATAAMRRLDLYSAPMGPTLNTLLSHGASLAGMAARAIEAHSRDTIAWTLDVLRWLLEHGVSADEVANAGRASRGDVRLRTEIATMTRALEQASPSTRPHRAGI